MNIPEISSYYPPFANQQKPNFNSPVVQSTPVPSISTAFLQKRTVEYVSGQEGANAYQLAPDSSALLLDKDMNVLWVVATDQNGSKSVVKGYNIGEEYTPPKPVTLDDLMAQMQSMNERLTKMEASGNGQSNFKSSGQGKSYGANASAGIRNGAGGSNRNANGDVEPKQSAAEGSV